ncbi:MAG: TasA family protein [Desulfosporosinus sp.]|nr:TasA family protein [Desulfosporosinus sp.]
MSLKKKLAMAVVTTTAGAAIMAAGSFALFTSTATNSANTFATGTVNVALSPTVGGTYASSMQSINVTGAAPGDAATVKTFFVKNTGSLSEYIMPKFVSCNVTPGDGTGAINLYDAAGVLNSNGLSSALTKFTGFGTAAAFEFKVEDLTTGQTLYDTAATSNPLWGQYLEVAPGSTDEIQLTYQLASTANNTYQGMNYTGSIEFDAVQSANNTQTVRHAKI